MACAFSDVGGRAGGRLQRSLLDDAVRRYILAGLKEVVQFRRAKRAALLPREDKSTE